MYFIIFMKTFPFNSNSYFAIYMYWRNLFMDNSKIEELINNMTIEEKLAQMTQLSPVFFWSGT